MIKNKSSGNFEKFPITPLKTTSKIFFYFSAYVFVFTRPAYPRTGPSIALPMPDKNLPNTITFFFGNSE